MHIWVKSGTSGIFNYTVLHGFSPRIVLAWSRDYLKNNFFRKLVLRFGRFSNFHDFASNFVYFLGCCRFSIFWVPDSLFSDFPRIFIYILILNIILNILYVIWYSISYLGPKGPRAQLNFWNRAAIWACCGSDYIWNHLDGWAPRRVGTSIVGIFGNHHITLIYNLIYNLIFNLKLNSTLDLII